MLIGFTGTPLLKDDKQRSIETFGPYIHTYKYDEAVGDGVVLDLRYEARDIDQNLTSEDQDRSDGSSSKTCGLSDVAKAQLKQRWGTMRKVLSARDRLEKIVADVLLDMETRDRLKSGRGNAMLVSDSIYSACRILRDVSTGPTLAGKCAIVTSYRPAALRTSRARRAAKGSPRSCAATARLSEAMLADALRRAGRDGDAQGGALRAGGEAALRRGAGADEAPHRGGQAADRFRRPAGDLPLHRQVRCGTTACSRPSAGSTASTARTRNTATSSTTRTCSDRFRSPSTTTPARPSTATTPKMSKGLLKNRLGQKAGNVWKRSREADQGAVRAGGAAVRHRRLPALLLRYAESGDAETARGQRT